MSSQNTNANKLEVDLTPILEALGLLKSEFVGYHPCPGAMPGVPEANDVDNEHGLSPELRRHLRVERRDAVTLHQLHVLSVGTNKLHDDVEGFVKEADTLYDQLMTGSDAQASVLTMYVKLTALIEKYNLKRCVRPPAPPTPPTRVQQIVRNLGEVLSRPESILALNQVLVPLGYHISCAANAGPQTATASTDESKGPVVTPPPASPEPSDVVKRVAAEVGLPVPKTGPKK